ncbi:MAG: aminoglycoside phosphotransferase family protein [Nocardioidaceae bacterium]
MIPAGLDEQRRLGPDWAGWLDDLPRLLAELLEEWQLLRDGDQLWHGYCSLVAPVRTPSGRPAALKLTFPGDRESEHEGLALQHWHGDGTVQLLRAHPARRALLIERLHREDLCSVGDLDACVLVAGFYRRLHRPALPQLRTVTEYVDRWLDALATLPRDAPLPHRLVDQTLSLGRAFVADPESVGRIVHGDLHYENVLAADREPWLVIDPKPMSGDPHYEIAPMLWNRWEEMGAASIRESIRRRFHTLVDVAGLDDVRARDWVVVRMVINAHWTIQDAQEAGRALSDEDNEWITRCIAIVKAVQD